jgi:hypothetical protein
MGWRERSWGEIRVVAGAVVLLNLMLGWMLRGVIG